MQHTARALNIGEVVAILKETIDGIEGGRDDEVVVVDKGDEGDEEWVNGVFINKIWHELRLGRNLHESDNNS